MVNEKKHNVFMSRKFFPLFMVQFLGVINDHTLKNALLVLVAFSGVSLFGLPKSQLVNLAIFLLILPFLLFSSYAGKIADTHNKVKVVRIIKFIEVIIMVFIAIGFIKSYTLLLFIALFAMGCHTAFFAPIKYSIIPQYLPTRDVMIGTGYVEMGTFIAILVGEAVGSWFMASGAIYFIVMLLMSCSLIGLYFSFKMPVLAASNYKAIYYKNVIKDSWLMYKEVTKDDKLRKNIYTVSWLWAFGAVFTTQTPIFMIHYLGANGHYFSLLLALFSIGIGVGSIWCASISKGIIHRQFVTFALFTVPVVMLVLLLSNLNVETHHFLTRELLMSWRGTLMVLVMFIIGICCGVYSLTCYGELQLNSPDNLRSQVIAANNLMNSIYMIIASVTSAILLIYVNVWWLFMILLLVNLLFAIWYYKYVYLIYK